jgi:hypothetical protein
MYDLINDNWGRIYAQSQTRTLNDISAFHLPGTDKEHPTITANATLAFVMSRKLN